MQICQNREDPESPTALRESELERAKKKRMKETKIKAKAPEQHTQT